MLPVDRWKIVYADGSEFTSEQGTWAEAPPFGVFAVVYYALPDSDMRNVSMNKDVYEYEGHVVGDDVTPVKFGLFVDGDTYYRLHDALFRTVTP